MCSSVSDQEIQALNLGIGFGVYQCISVDSIQNLGCPGSACANSGLGSRVGFQAAAVAAVFIVEGS